MLFAVDDESDSECSDYPYLEDESSLKSSTKILKYNLSDTNTSNHIQLPDESKINTTEALNTQALSTLNDETKNSSAAC